MTTPDDQEALNAIARSLQTVEHNIGRALPLVQKIAERRDTLGDLDTCAGLLGDASRSAASAQQAVVHGLGAQQPGLRTAREDLRLDQLNTPASRYLLSLLQETLTAAQELDQERGWVDEDGNAIGWAETIQGWVLGLRREVYGAKGRGGE